MNGFRVCKLQPQQPQTEISFLTTRRNKKDSFSCFCQRVCSNHTCLKSSCQWRSNNCLGLKKKKKREKRGKKSKTIFSFPLPPFSLPSPLFLQTDINSSESGPPAAIFFWSSRACWQPISSKGWSTWREREGEEGKMRFWKKIRKKK